MYAHFYQLAENPFNLTPDPKFHYINESTREALASILYGINSRKGFITLIGEAGTGKTTLLKRIVDEIEGETIVVFVFNPGVSFDELLEFICMELGIPTEGARRLNLLERLNEFLLQQLTEGRNVAVMIDEAQTLTDGVLEELRLLSNLETSKEKILQIVLSGQTELEEKLRRPNLRQLRQRIGVRGGLKPMRADEIRAYVETRLRGAGSERTDLFTPGALRAIWQASQGIPRVINVICDNAMMLAFAEGRDRINATVARAAIRDLNGETRVQEWLRAGLGVFQEPMARYAVAGAVVLGLGGSATWWAMQSDPAPVAQTPRRPPVEIAMTAPSEAVAPVAAVTPPRPAPRPAPVLAPPPVAGAPGSIAGAQPGVSVPRLGLPPGSRPGLAPAANPSAPAPGLPGGQLVPPTNPAPASQPYVALEAPGGTPRAAGALAPANPDTMNDSVRRAEVIARSTAARLFEDRGKEAQKDILRAADFDTVVPGMPVNAAGQAPAPDSVGQRSRQAAEAMAAEVFERAAAEREAAARAAAEREAERLARAAEAERQAASARAAAEARAEAASPSTNAALWPSAPSPEVPAAPAVSGGLAAVAGMEASAPDVGAMADVPSNPLRSGDPLIGRLVPVRNGDTLWAIALQYYGAVDPRVLTEIFRNNAGIQDARRLEVGQKIYLPFFSADQMIRPDQGGRYKVLLAESPEQSVLDRSAGWVRTRVPGTELQTVTRGRGRPVKMLYAVGLPSRTTALELARKVRGEFSAARGR